MAVRPVRLIVPRSVRVLRPTAPDQYLSYIGVALREVRGPLKRIAQENSPVGATERLRDRIVESSSSLSVAVEWIAAHAGFAQYGTRAHWAPLQPLRQWAAAKLGDPGLAYAIRATIAKKGTRPSRFLERTRRAVVRDIIPAFRQRMQLLARFLSGDFP